MVEGRGLRDYRSTYILICGCALGHSLLSPRRPKLRNTARPAGYIFSNQTGHPLRRSAWNCITRTLAGVHGIYRLDVYDQNTVHYRSDKPNTGAL